MSVELLGSVVEVKLFPSEGFARWKRIGSEESFLNKRRNHIAFNALTSDIQRVQPLLFRGEIDNIDILDIDLARGVNLSGHNLKDLLQLGDTLFRYENMITYLQVVSKLNRSKYAFVDHKQDSVFCFKNTLGRIPEGISVADTDQMTMLDTPEMAWREDSKESNHLRRLLASFFTQGVTPGMEDLIPACIRTIIEHPLKEFSSAEDLLGQLYIFGGVPSSIYDADIDSADDYAAHLLNI